MHPEISDFITGHGGGSVSKKYGDHWVVTFAQEIAKLPRYEIAGAVARKSQAAPVSADPPQGDVSEVAASVNVSCACPIGSRHSASLPRPKGADIEPPRVIAAAEAAKRGRRKNSSKVGMELVHD